MAPNANTPFVKRDATRHPRSTPPHAQRGGYSRGWATVENKMMKPGDWVTHNNELYLVFSVDPRVPNYCRAIREDGMVRAGIDFVKVEHDIAPNNLPPNNPIPIPVRRQ